MPSIDDVFGGTALKSTDIKGKDPTVTIADVVVEIFKDKDGTEKQKLRVHFKGAKKSLVCNVTNARRIAHLYGADYTKWAGHKIKLKVEMVDFGGNVVDGIRVYPPDGGDKIETSKRAMPIEQEMNDEVPW